MQKPYQSKGVSKWVTVTVIGVGAYFIIQWIMGDTGTTRFVDMTIGDLSNIFLSFWIGYGAYSMIKTAFDVYE